MSDSAVKRNMTILFSALFGFFVAMVILAQSIVA